MAARVHALSFLCALGLLAGCGADGHKGLGRDAQAITTDAEAEQDADPGTEEEFDADVEPPEPEEDTGPGPELDAALDSGPDQDAALDGGNVDAADADVADASGQDAGETPDVDVPDAADAAPTPHPLAGKYAARTQLYARQHTAVALDNTGDPTPFDMVSKAILYSVVEIDLAGVAHEQYCFFEVANELVSSWTNPTAVLRVPASAVPLQTEGDRVVRSLDAHSVALSWNTQAPADCVAGQLHSTGCTCPTGNGLPKLPTDCRVTDLDQDGVPGTDMYVAVGGAPETLDGDGAAVILRVAARVRVGWNLPATPGDQIKGSISGGFEQQELSRENLIGVEIEPILNAMCPESLGHIELRKGEFDCTSLMARRTKDTPNYGLFDLELDQTPPAVEQCPDPTQQCDGARDECGVCNGPGKPAGKCDCEGHVLDVCGVCNGTGIKPGTCACGDDTPAPTWYQDSDGDGKGDPAQSQQACQQPNGYVATADDTDPGCAGVRDECNVCNGQGKPANACDCSGKAPTAWYEDKDGDGKGDPNVMLENCVQPTGFVDNALDTDPTCATPRDTCGVCNGTGIPAGKCDCAGHVLDECGACNGPGKPANACDCDGTAPKLWYEDKDADGKGDPAVAVESCTQPTGFVDNALDTYPACNGQPDECGACNGPGKPAGKCDCQGTPPDACNVCGGNNSTCAGCDGVPNSGKVKDACGVCGGNNSSCAGCDGVPGSGKVNDVCGVCGGPGIPAGKCDCQGTLPGTWYLDVDQDGLGDASAATLSCTQPPGYVAVAGDPHPACAGQPDVCNVCNGPGFPADTCDCAGTAKKLWYEDADGDGLGDPAKSQRACTKPNGYVDNPNDTSPACNGQPDQCNVCNGPGIPAGKCNCAGAVNDACGVCGGPGIPAGKCDCAGTLPKLWYGDSDGDGKGDPAVSQSACTAPAGYVGNSTDTDPSCGSARDACGKCGGSATACPILGTYAVRNIVYTKGKSGTQTTAAKAINYTLTKISLDAAGRTVQAREQNCYSESLPVGEGTAVYSWSKPEWMQKIPPVTIPLIDNANGTWTRTDPAYSLGWQQSRRPGTCSDANPTGTATPLASAGENIWPSSAGNSCTCNKSTDVLPPFNKSSTYDCRLVDLDQDGYPGVSVFGALSAPSSPSADAGGLSWGRLMVASLPSSRWTISVAAADRNHTAVVNDSGQSSVVGCVGGGLIISACSQVNGQPSGTVCPERFNKGQFKPVADNYTCDQVVTNRGTLFSTASDGTLPDNTVCPPP